MDFLGGGVKIIFFIHEIKLVERFIPDRNQLHRVYS